MKAKRSKPKQSSALYKKALVSFPSLSFSATALLYLLVFEFSIVTVNRVKELGPFIQACQPDKIVPDRARQKNCFQQVGQIVPASYRLCLLKEAKESFASPDYLSYGKPHI